MMFPGRFAHENKLPLSVLGVVFGSLLTAISIFSMLYADGKTGLYLWAHDTIGNWSFWVIILGLVLLAGGGYYLSDFIIKLREFRRHMKISSKAKFIKNLDRIEELAWHLHPKYERMVIERKEKFRIRR